VVASTIAVVEQNLEILALARLRPDATDLIAMNGTSGVDWT